jgi:small-conductance mechanosensitive channel
MTDLLDSASATAGLAAVAAIAAALLVHAFAVRALRRALRGRLMAEMALDRASAPLRWIIVFAALSATLEATPGGLPAEAALRHAATLGLIGSATWLAARIIDAVVEAIVLANPADVADNLHARIRRTQARVLGRTVKLLAFTIGIAAALTTFPGVRQLGATLLASAGVVGLVAGLAARPVLSNVMAGLQIALTQPIRIDDVLIVSGEWGRVEQITGAYVVLKLWDERRLVIPLNWFIENPFENWTRSSSQIVGSVFLWIDYGAPIAALRAEFLRLCREAPEWDGRVASLQVTDASERAIRIRGIASASNAGMAWDLRCRLREGLIEFMRREHPQGLPRLRVLSLDDQGP